MILEANGVSLHYEVRGQGPPMILLHGNGEDHTVFDRSAEVLGRTHRLYLVDSRGHGESSDVEEFHYDDMARDLELLVSMLGLRRPVLVGYSDGAIVGILAASRNPGMFSHLVLCGANTRPSALKGMYMFRCRHSRRMRADPRIRMMLEEPDITAEDLSRIDTPTLLVFGSRDCIREDDIEFMSSSIRGSRLLVLKGETHGSYIEGSSKLATIVLDELGLDDDAEGPVRRGTLG